MESTQLQVYITSRGENGIIEKKEISSLAKKNKNNIVNRVVDKLFIKEGKTDSKESQRKGKLIRF